MICKFSRWMFLVLLVTNYCISNISFAICTCYYIIKITNIHKWKIGTLNHACIKPGLIDNCTIEFLSKSNQHVFEHNMCFSLQWFWFRMIRRVWQNGCHDNFRPTHPKKISCFTYNVLVIKAFSKFLPYSSTLRKKCPYSELFWPVFSHIRTKLRENTNQDDSEYGHFFPSAISSYFFLTFNLLMLWNFCSLVAFVYSIHVNIKNQLI